MKGLLVKDLLNLRRYASSLLIMVGVFVFFALMVDNGDILEGMIILAFTIMTVTTFSYDDLARWDPYALSLPVSRKQIVLGKYVLAILLALLGILLSLAVNGALAFFRKIDMAEKLLSSYAIFAIALVFISILLPLIYKFGVEKSRIFLILIFAAPTAAILALANAGIPMPKEEDLRLLLNLSPAILVVLICGSYALSNSIFAKKDL